MVDIQKHVEKGSGERKIQLEEDGDDSTRQSWTETSVIIIIIVVTIASSDSFKRKLKFYLFNSCFNV